MEQRYSKEEAEKYWREKLMQERNDMESSSTEDTSDIDTEEEYRGQGGSPGLSQNLYECRLVTRDPEGAEIKISGQAFVNYKIQLPAKGNEDQEGLEEEEKVGQAEGSYDHGLHGPRGDFGGQDGIEQKSQGATVSNCRHDSRKIEGDYGHGRRNFSQYPDAPGEDKEDGTGYEGDEEGFDNTFRGYGADYWKG